MSLVQWIQEANKEFVRDNAKRIKKSFQQCAFLNNVDGSDDKLIDLRAGSENIDMAKEYFPISQFAKTDVSMDCLEPDLTVQELLDELDNQADSDKEKDEVVSKATHNVEAIVKRRQRKKRFEMAKQKRRELRKIPKKVQQCQSIGNHENKNGKRKNIGKSNILDIVPKIIKSRKRKRHPEPLEKSARKRRKNICAETNSKSKNTSSSTSGKDQKSKAFKIKKNTNKTNAKIINNRPKIT